MLPFVVKYRPQTLEGIVGHDSVTERIVSWITGWKHGNRQKPILLYGKAGIGKTSIVQALAHDFDLEILEMNASDTRTAAVVEKIAGSASLSQTFSGKMRVILFDEVDGLYLQDRGGSATINKILKESGCPIILTANDVWDKKLSTIRTACELIEVKKVHSATVAKLLKNISEQEKIDVDYDLLKEIAKNAEGDVRSAINDLEFLAGAMGKIKPEDLKILTQRDHGEKSMFNIVQVILKTMDFSHALEAIKNVDENPDFILAWVAENIPKEYKNKEDLHNAYEMISRADIFLGRVHRRQNYSFWKYANVLMSAGVALSKTDKYSGFTRYSFPSGISYLSASKEGRDAQKSAAQKIAAFCHTSTRTAIADYLPMFNDLMKKDELAAAFTLSLNFTEDDLDSFGIQFPKRVLEQVDVLKKENVKKQYVSGKNQNLLSKFF